MYLSMYVCISVYLCMYVSMYLSMYVFFIYYLCMLHYPGVIRHAVGIQTRFFNR